jgi:hypothetical protein
MKIADNLQKISRRYQLFLLGWIWLAYGCGDRQTTKEVLLEFKQQPDEKYVYNVADSVEWEFVDVDQKRCTFLHLQEQKSEMVIESLDSAMVRSLTMSFVVTKDTLLNPPEMVLSRKRRSQVGLKFGFVLRMRKNGEIVKVVTEDPKIAFEFDRTYKPSQPVFPDRAIAPGYAWTQNFSVEVPRGSPTVATTQYKLNSFTRIDQFDCAVIDFKGEVEYEESYKPPADKPKVDFLLRKYHSQVTSEGQIFFAYREGFMVKRFNLITSTVQTTTFVKDKVEQQSKSVVKDYEFITLTAIHHPGEAVISYRIP